MIPIYCNQNTPEWDAARLAIPTASKFDKILTPASLKPSKSADAYRFQLLGEWFIGFHVEGYKSKFMEQGKEFEHEARLYYEMETGNDVEQIGFAYLDEKKLVGCSPDGLVGTEGGVEIKCVIPSTQVERMLDNQPVPNEYLLQIHGSIWICNRQWWDFLSYQPDLKHGYIVRVHRDETIIEKLKAAINSFNYKMQEEREHLKKVGLPYLEH
jgi:hypothetical protein